MAEKGIDPDMNYRLKQKRNCAYAMKLATDSVDTIYALAGANGPGRGERRRRRRHQKRSPRFRARRCGTPLFRPARHGRPDGL
jgi:hypothetical protein